MKAFIEKVFKMKQQKQKELLDEITHTEVIQENKEILSKQIETSIKEKVKQKFSIEVVAKQNAAFYKKLI